MKVNSVCKVNDDDKTYPYYFSFAKAGMSAVEHVYILV